jgi:hypothetical protein
MPKAGTERTSSKHKSTKKKSMPKAHMNPAKIKKRKPFPSRMSIARLSSLKCGKERQHLQSRFAEA